LLGSSVSRFLGFSGDERQDLRNVAKPSSPQPEEPLKNGLCRRDVQTVYRCVPGKGCELNTAEKVIFLDPSRKRWAWIKRVGTLLGLASAILISFFLLSVFTMPVLPTMPGITTAIKRSLTRTLPRHQTKLQQYVARRYRERLLAQIALDRQRLRSRAAEPLVKSRAIVAAFYAPWQETGLHSLKANAGKMTHLFPAWLHLKADATGIDLYDFDEKIVPHNTEVLKEARASHLNIIPVFNNVQTDPYGGTGQFKPERVHTLLTNGLLQDRLIMQLRQFLLANRFQGINIDFENLSPASDYKLLPDFLSRLERSFRPFGLIVTTDIEAGSTALDWRRIAAASDFVIVMAYDEHTEVGPPGPIASIDWYRRVLNRALAEIPRDKLVIGLANYGFDWTRGDPDADVLTYQGALVTAREYHPDETPQEMIDFDPKALNPTFTYVDEKNREHEVWFLDAVTAVNQWMIAQTYGVRGAAVWVLGSSDPSLWEFLDRNHIRWPPKPLDLEKVRFPYDVEFIGEGEILHVDRLPADGARDLEIEKTTGLVIDEDYSIFPTSYVIRRSGYQPKKIALTIDDGPAVPYSAQMLDILKKYNVKATFFLIGENAARYPGLVRRMWGEGHELGNHTFTHPNIGSVSEKQADLELNSTQRVLQSIIGRSTLLFRPPYNADAEPESLEEVLPVVRATRLGYITVGEFLDPQDWNIVDPATGVHRTANDMLQSVLSQLGSEQGSSILLHDGGGNRTETVKLLPLLITELSKRGYEFVTVSQLVGATREEVMPPVSKTDTLMLADDRLIFEAIYLGELFLGIAFVSAIALGTARMIFVIILALLARRRTAREHFDETFTPSVNVLIAAYNEQRVIARTIRAVLDNEYPGLEIIVIDDGSKDGTAAEVRREFGNDPRIRLIEQENAGKAAALNRGIQNARAEILIALDADTLFARDTIRKLVRRFIDPQVGAVAGNVKVGNRLNPLTYWQAIEYITSQNLDRRAYSLINSVPVVPGAVGAWRREAIRLAGGYTSDTMAEDMDLTWRIRRIGWKIDAETEAVGYTEAPDSFRALFTQRFRWAFGTLQSLWKHRRALGRYGWFGRVMLPSLWLFQIAYQALSPLVDLQIVWSLSSVMWAWFQKGRLFHDWQPLPSALGSLYLVGFMYAFFFVLELIGSIVAFKLDREDGRMLVWLFWQRFLYRQLMYAVLLKSVKTAFSGIRAGWGKLERKGTVQLATD
jgi:cellulose synthase/poly-beta-1,6-N-acetylglucosamine synthase-like glycosyltransferase/spore germination protein YaaH/peptidoglycan/xylan/chitin deacetylase (PgdA/CDA1 family)